MHPKPVSYKDRTVEFNSITGKLKLPSSLTSTSGASSNGSRDGGSISTLQEPSRSVVPPIKSDFNKRASKIGLGIHHTSKKLARLAQLAKRTSVFDDPAREIQELTAVIKQEISALNSAVVDLQLMCNSQNEGSMSSDSNAHSSTVVDSLKNGLMSATKEFKEVLTMRTENLKVHENRRQLFSSSASKEDSSNPFIRQRPLATRTAASAAISPLPWASDSGTSSQSFTRNPSDGESTPFLQQQQSQQQQLAAPLQDTYMQSRSEALHSVESTIHELGSIFTQLANMVSQQGELAIRIDENMEDTLANVEGAQGQLVRYFRSISSNRWLMIKLFLILILFLMIFLFFVA